MAASTPAKPKEKNAKKPRRQRRWMTAATSDPHVLYEKAVQDPEAEVEFIEQVWREKRNRRPTTLREDFCGTAIASCAWVRHRRANTAIGVDIDSDVLAWAQARISSRLKPAEQKRLTLLEENVMSVRCDPVDTVVAMNFSYFLFKSRDALRKYFKRVHKGLVSDGVFILDAYGGSDSFLEMEEERDCDGFTYVWDQNTYNPITGDVINHIHFRFPDGSEIREAFTYDWRLWTLPELREILIEAGFADVTVYWEGTDPKTEEGNGEFTATMSGDACEGWIAYLVATK